MNHLDPEIQQWLSKVLTVPFHANKHIHSHQDEVFKIVTSSGNYYLKVSSTLKAEHDNLQKLEPFLNIPKVINFHQDENRDYLLLGELPGKNLVELIDEWPKTAIVETFAHAIRQLHSLDATKVFPNANPGDVLLHGDMALPNIIISAAGAVGYIDFGQLTYGTPELDMADAIWSLQRNFGQGYGELFLQKYGPVARTPKIEEALAFTYQPAEKQ